ncbi:hypothetical protein BKA67DRAFT_539882 [Truncatella angustata]|uniref:Uncharacterized protein n=1 Tax=Truncatella angustata TaxID=152316 RepID=A0A9P8UDR7_9PEZI|nr:uncharacterized protein BKA67DRAFT_539882 [Truncatella angustata]KAH6648057.1 hypothetical protein BKA67DRAFT_539882 [Truncatella angustata]
MFLLAVAFFTGMEDAVTSLLLAGNLTTPRSWIQRSHVWQQISTKERTRHCSLVALEFGIEESYLVMANKNHQLGGDAFMPDTILKHFKPSRTNPIVPLRQSMRAPSGLASSYPATSGRTSETVGEVGKLGTFPSFSPWLILTFGKSEMKMPWQ